MSDDIFADFGKAILDVLGPITGVGPIPVSIGKVVIDAISAEEKRTAAHDSLKKKVKNKDLTNLTKEEIPILRRALNRTINILSRGHIKDALE